MALVIQLSQPNTTVDLSKFNNIDINNIDWGDGTITHNTYTHTYATAQRWVIEADFSNVNTIFDNFNIPNLRYIKFPDMYNLETISDGFLKNCTELTSLDMSNFMCTEIGDNFLDGCTNLTALKVPYNDDPPTLKSWGSNLNTNLKILCGIFSDEYKVADVWKEKKDVMSNVDIVYDTIDEERIYKLTNVNVAVLLRYLKLTHFPNIQQAITNNELLLYDNSLMRNPETKQLVRSKDNVKKTYFIFRYGLRFKYNQTDTETHRYWLNLLVRADNIKDGKLYLNTETIDNTYFYLTSDDVDFNILQQKYAAPILLKDNEESHYYEMNILAYHEWQDRDDPNYAMGKLIFGIIDESNMTNIDYKGDASTGFTIKISANGICKNPIIYSNILNSKTKRRPFIKINTDQFPEGSILDGDYIEICTIAGKKSATLRREGNTINIINFIDIDSSWLKLVKGINPFFCTADIDAGSIMNLKIRINYNDLYVGI